MSEPAWMFSGAIVRPPGLSFKRGLTTIDLGRPDHERALSQHEAYCQALESCGLSLTRLDADELFPDSTFVEDTAVLTTRGAIVARPGAPSRTLETNGISAVLTGQFSEVHHIVAPGKLDGGDVCDANGKFFIGISERTNPEGANQLASLLSLFGYESVIIDIRGAQGLHLKSSIAYVGDNKLVITDSLSTLKEFREFDRIVVAAGEEYSANCVRVNDRVLIASGFPGLAESLRNAGFRTIALEMSEFQKLDGGLSCLSLRY